MHRAFLILLLISMTIWAQQDTILLKDKSTIICNISNLEQVMSRNHLRVDYKINSIINSQLLSNVSEIHLIDTVLYFKNGDLQRDSNMAEEVIFTQPSSNWVKGIYRNYDDLYYNRPDTLFKNIEFSEYIQKKFAPMGRKIPSSATGTYYQMKVLEKGKAKKWKNFKHGNSYGYCDGKSLYIETGDFYSQLHLLNDSTSWYIGILSSSSYHPGTPGATVSTPGGSFQVGGTPGGFSSSSTEVVFLLDNEQGKSLPLSQLDLEKLLNETPSLLSEYKSLKRRKQRTSVRKYFFSYLKATGKDL